ncbi:hypothetical protein BDZ89DRAFT_1057492 [Hymenopellis radicata]|nr:hypothetical protein BDZ89DRAFT_1057492 [Hymenopellis radicata]
MTPRLPVELYRHIIDHFNSDDRRTLQALSLTSTTWSIEAERVLYKHFDNYPSATTQQLFLQRVIACPRVGSLVETFKISMNYPIKPLESAALIALVSQALMNMPNLRSFAFRTTGGQPAARSILSACPFQLEEFNWGCHGDEKDLLAFLETQHSLRVVTIDSWDASRFGWDSVPLSVTPEIVSLSGRYGTIAAFLPGRRISQVDWVPDLDDPEPDGELLGSALRHLQTLSFGGYFMRPDLSSIAEYLADLRYLELRGIQADDLDCIPRIPRLETLKISMQWVQDIPIPVSNHKEVALKLFKQCSNLTKITIASKKHNHWSSDYKQWSRPSNNDPIPCTDIPFDSPTLRD